MMIIVSNLPHTPHMQCRYICCLHKARGLANIAKFDVIQIEQVCNILRCQYTVYNVLLF